MLFAHSSAGVLGKVWLSIVGGSPDILDKIELGYANARIEWRRRSLMGSTV